jgi:hypothetical protein
LKDGFAVKKKVTEVSTGKREKRSPLVNLVSLVVEFLSPPAQNLAHQREICA